MLSFGKNGKVRSDEVKKTLSSYIHARWRTQAFISMGEMPHWAPQVLVLFKINISWWWWVNQILEEWMKSILDRQRLIWCWQWQNWYCLWMIIWDISSCCRWFLKLPLAPIDHVFDGESSSMGVLRIISGATNWELGVISSLVIGFVANCIICGIYLLVSLWLWRCTKMAQIINSSVV